jgi:hypothetical protein
LCWRSLNRILQIDSEVADNSAHVIAEVEMVVLAPFTTCSPIATGCTGTRWDLRSGKPKPMPGTRDNFVVGYRLRIEKSFAFQRADGGWRCSSSAMRPVEAGIALSGP